MEKVSQKTYDIVYKRCDGKCQHPCCKSENVEYHHVIYRGECRRIIDDPRDGTMLCPEHHKEGEQAPHTSRFWKYYYYQFLPKDFLEEYSPVKWAYIEKILNP